jgi:hypothetical protein
MRIFSEMSAPGHIAAQSQSGGMSAADESGLCIASRRLAWTLLGVTSAAIARGEPVHRSASALPQAVLGVKILEKVERASRAAT